MATPPAPSWTYTGDPANVQLDEFRFLVQDADDNLHLLSDGECQYLIDKWLPRYGSITYAASVGAAVISRKFAGVASVSADGVTVNVSDLSDRYAKVAAALRDEHERGQTVEGEVDLTNLMAGDQNDPSIDPLVFAMGLFDNPEAGQQNYGGELWYPIIEWSR